MQRAIRIASRSAGALVVLLLALGSANTVSAQYLISSKSGFINRVEGKVYIQRQENENGDRGRATLGTQMKDGDILATDLDSRAEILLNPGSYLRLAPKTEVRALNTSFIETRFELIKGSVMVEVGELEKRASIELMTPSGPVSVIKPGLQRIDSDGRVTTIAVRQGEVYLGSSEQALAKRGIKIKRGKMVRLEGLNTAALAAAPEQLKIDKDKIDEFDVWSYNRAQTLMAANYSVLRRRSISNSLAYGWYFDPFFNCYTFIPGRGYYSPYGFPFFHRYSDFAYYFPYGLPYYPGYYGRPGNGGSGGGGGGGVPVGAPARVIAGHDRPAIRREMEGRGLDITSGSDRGFSRPSYGGGSASAPAASAPVSTGTVSAPSAPVTVGGGGGGGRPGRP